MTRNQASIIVERDNSGCATVMEVFLTTTARGYDERNVEDDLAAAEWISNDDYDFCSPDCCEEKLKEKE